MGRTQTLLTLQHHLARAELGAGHWVAIIGESGIGKTRLWQQFRSLIADRHLLVLEARVEPNAPQRPFAPFLNAIEIWDRTSRTREDVGSPIRRDWKAICDACSRPMGVVSSRPGLSLTAQIARLLGQIAAAQPTVLALDDWHWRDLASNEIMMRLSAAISDLPLLILTLSRPELGQHDFGSHQTIRLGRLNRLDATRLIQSQLTPSQRHTRLDDVIQYGAGNPLLLTELCRANEPSDANDVSHQHSPDASIEEVIRSRINGLAHAERETLSCAAIASGTFTIGLLAHASPVHPSVLGDSLASLCDQGFLVALSADAFRFAHRAIEHVAFWATSARSRRAYHRSIAHWLDATDDGANPSRIAWHYHESGDLRTAARYYRTAGDHAMRLSLLGDARRHYRTALEALDGLAKSDRQQRAYTDVSLRLARASHYAPSPDLTRILRDAMKSTDPARDPYSAAELTFRLGRHLYLFGDLSSALHYATDCVQQTDTIENHNLRGVALATIGRINVFLGEHRQAIRYLEQSIDSLRAVEDYAECAYAHSFVGIAWSALGQFSSALRHANVSVACAQKSDNPSHLAMALKQLARIQARMGQLDSARTNALSAFRLANQLNDSFTAGNALLVAGWSQELADQSGIATMLDAARLIEQTSARLSLTVNFGVIAECCALRAHPDTEQYVAKAFHAISHFGDRFGDSFAYRARALWLASGQSPDLPQAYRCLEHTLRTSLARNERAFTALTRFRWAQIAQRAGDHAIGAREAKRAHALFDTMGLSYWVAHIETLGYHDP
ncbi:MAG: AAA family ATPase [Pseudomonadota bacterium]